MLHLLFQASSVSTRTQPLHITLSPSPVEVEDLRDYAQYLSYRNLGQRHQTRIYDFPDEQHAADASMHLQIVFRWEEGILVITRAQRPSPFFYESDE